MTLASHSERGWRAAADALEVWVSELGARVTGAVAERWRPVVLNEGALSEPCDAAGLIDDLRVCVARVKSAHAQTDNVDYAAIARDPLITDHMERMRCLQDLDPTTIGSEAAQRAFWINLYNLLTVDAFVRGGVGPGQLARVAAFRRVRYVVDGQPFSMDDIEHGVLRANRAPLATHRPHFKSGDPRRRYAMPTVDARVHMALNCAARSCPPIAAYDGGGLDDQLDLASAAFVNGGGAEFDDKRNALALSRIFRWSARDFGGMSGVIAFVRRYAERELASWLTDRDDVDIAWQPYDWSLNGTLGV